MVYVIMISVDFPIDPIGFPECVLIMEIIKINH